MRKKEEEELKKKPWQEEIALCDFLINYLKKLLAKETKKTEDASTAAKSNGEVVPTLEGFEGMKVSQKKKDNEDNFMVMGGASKKKKTKAKRKEKDETITHSLDLLSSFSVSAVHYQIWLRRDGIIIVLLVAVVDSTKQGFGDRCFDCGVAREEGLLRCSPPCSKEDRHRKECKG